MIFARTGQTLYETVVSLDVDNNPITATTFTKSFFVNGSLNTGVTLSVSISDYDNGIFISSWSASTEGIHQYHLLNNATNTVFISDVYNIRPDDDFATTVFVGL